MKYAKLRLFFSKQAIYYQQDLLLERFSCKTAYVGRDKQWHHFNWIFMLNKMQVLILSVCLIV